MIFNFDSSNLYSWKSHIIYHSSINFGPPAILTLENWLRLIVFYIFELIFVEMIMSTAWWQSPRSRFHWIMYKKSYIVWTIQVLHELYQLVFHHFLILFMRFLHWNLQFYNALHFIQKKIKFFNWNFKKKPLNLLQLRWYPFILFSQCKTGSTRTHVTLFP